MHVGLDGDGGGQEEEALDEVVPGGERVQPGQDLWKQNENEKLLGGEKRQKAKCLVYSGGKEMSLFFLKIDFELPHVRSI